MESVQTMDGFSCLIPKPIQLYIKLTKVMASIGFGTSLAEAYTIRKMYKEKMKKMEQEEGERKEDGKSSNMKINNTITTNRVPKDEISSSGCFSWVSNKQQRKKNSRISDSNDE
ncbi:uncharacterized protein LOC127740696 [Arachis duranensis]|uniref:Uncharacterized protein LOC127740696 n=1 Tax=Arachis duranensis TaxID=130453 RepID=A0A9C6WFU6_ARADU|nr:uncharacterized protein LOC127740696 [Arachis duranensis]